MKDIDSRLLSKLFIKEYLIDIDEDPWELLIWDNINDLSGDRVFSIGEPEKREKAESVYFGIGVFYTLQTDIKHFLDNYTSLETELEGYGHHPCQTGTQGFIEISLFQKESQGIPACHAIFRLGLEEAERFLGLINLLIEKHEENLKAQKDRV